MAKRKSRGRKKSVVKKKSGVTRSKAKVSQVKKELLLQDNDFVAAKHIKEIMELPDVNTKDLHKSFDEWIEKKHGG